MKTETRYKLVALLFFFVLFAAYFLQFVRPYYLFRPVSMPGDLSEAQLGYNGFILPLAFVAAGLLGYLLFLYRQARPTAKLLPLIGSLILLGLLFYVHAVNHPQNLDPGTRHSIMDLLGASG